MARSKAAARIRRVTNAHNSEPVVPAKGRFASFTIWIENLPSRLRSDRPRCTRGWRARDTVLHRSTRIGRLTAAKRYDAGYGSSADAPIGSFLE